jgi:hypothetical protein
MTARQQSLYRFIGNIGADEQELVDYYAPEPRRKLSVAHPAWLGATAVAILALVLIASPVLAFGRAAYKPNSPQWSAYMAWAQKHAGQQEAALPVIDTTTAPAPAEQAPTPEAGKASAGYELTGPPTISVAQIESVLAQYGSPAAGKGQALFDLGVRYGINPAYALAFFVHESGCGTKGVARSTRSIGNIRWTPGYDNFEGYRIYPTWEEGMEDWYRLITDLYINGWGLRTVEQIVPRYAPWGDNNNPPAYIESVKWLVDSWRGK